MKAFDNELAAFTHKQELRAAYQRVPAKVIADLAEFCFAYETTFDADPRLDARKQGRRDVWLRLQAHLKLTDEQLYQIATGRFIPPTEDDDQ